MTFIKSVIFGAVAFSVITVSTACYAQGKMPDRAQRQLVWMQKNLSLTDEQNAKVADIVMHYAAELRKTNAELPRGAEKQVQKKELHRNQDAELGNVLTANQYKALHKHMREVRQQKMQNKANMQQGRF